VVVPSLLILSTLTMGTVCSSETSVLTTATWRHIPKDGIPHIHHHENLKTYKIIIHCYNVTSRNGCTLVSSSFSLYIGRLCLCSNRVMSVYRPTEQFFPPLTCFFHSGSSWLVSPMPRMLAAKVLPSARHKINKMLQ
jgi:hypothetical protein